MPDKAVIKYLEEKYSQDFELISSDYLSETGNYDIRLSPKENPEIVFKVDHNPKKKNFNDYYPYAIWQYQADQYLRGFLDELNVPYALRTGFSANVEVNPNDIITFESIIKEHAGEASLNLFIHLFGNVDAETISTLVKLDEFLRPIALKKVGVTTRLYHEFSIKDKDFKDLNIDFGVSTEGTFEADNTEHFLGLIKYRIDNKNEESPSTEVFQEIMVENPNHMMFKKL